MSPEPTPLPVPRFSEPWQRTAIRTGGLTLVVALVAAVARRNLGAGVIALLIAPWFAVGGHFVELFYLNILRPRLVAASVPLLAARLAFWFVGGVVLYFAALASVRLVVPRPPAFPWWGAGLGFIGIELLVHAGLRSRGQSNAYDGRG